jgi:ribosomal protein S18 acetylase RimI-like enzyme
MKLTIREAQLADLPGILAVYAQPEMDDGQVLSQEQAEAIYRKIQSYPSYRLYVAETGGRIAGTFALLIMDNLAHLGKKSAVVEDVGVLPEFQGGGIGREMMRAALGEAGKHQCYKLTLSSNLKREKAHRFYDSLGFSRHGYSFLVEPGSEDR